MAYDNELQAPKRRYDALFRLSVDLQEISFKTASGNFASEKNQRLAKNKQIVARP